MPRAIALAATVSLAAILVWLATLEAGSQPADHSPTPSPHGASIVEEGDSIGFAAIDADGPWAEISVTRGPDTGGYPDAPVGESAFVVEIAVTYRIARPPVSGAFGRDDWSLVFADDGLPAGRLFEPALPPDPARVDPSRVPLGAHVTGAAEWAGEVVTGVLYFIVDRGHADRPLALVYRSAAGDEVMPLAVRSPGRAPDPVAAATPPPTPGPVTYVDVAGMPFTVIDNAAADALFTEPQRCTRAAPAYSMAFPAGWHEVNCRWFGPTPFEVRDPAQLPAEAVISVEVVDGMFGTFNRPELVLRQAVQVGGTPGWRLESVGTHHEGGGFEPHAPVYTYSATFGPDHGPPSMHATTTSTAGHDTDTYALYKAVLDRMMASFSIGG